MPINQAHKLTLLTDILNNHQSDCCGSITEYEQLERLITSLKTNGQINQDILPILEEINQYCQQGIQASNVTNHIHSYQNQLTQWVGSISDLS